MKQLEDIVKEVFHKHITHPLSESPHDEMLDELLIMGIPKSVVFWDCFNIIVDLYSIEASAVMKHVEEVFEKFGIESPDLDHLH